MGLERSEPWNEPKVIFSDQQKDNFTWLISADDENDCS